MNFDKVSTKTLRQQVYDQLRRKIISAEIMPGRIMTLQGLAKEFGVSVMPVREALWQLESERVIVIESNKRVYVNRLTRKEMEEVLSLRLMLESMAAERACERITREGLARTKQILEGMKAAFDRPKRYVSLNSQFHFTIYSYADSPMLLVIIDSLWARIAPYFNIMWEKGGGHSFTMDFHVNMYRALVKKDKAQLKHWLQEDLTQAARIIVPFLEDGKDAKT